MATYGAVIVSRNDNYGGNLKERAIYALNSSIDLFDAVVFVDYNSRGNTLIDDIKNSLIHSGKMLVVKVTHEEHLKFTQGWEHPQPCSEVLGRNIGLRRLATDFLVSTNVDNIQPSRNELETFTRKDAMMTIARKGINYSNVSRFNPKDAELIRAYLRTQTFPQSYAVTREPWSLVEWCGDFQIAHKDVWYNIRGFSEQLLGVGVHDSYSLRQAKEAGYITYPDYVMNLWHIDHSKGNDYGEWGEANSLDCLYSDNKPQENSETWGFSDVDFDSFIL